MINKIINKSKNILIKPILHCYSELTYTSQLKIQQQLEKIPTFRLIDTSGKLLNPNLKYDCQQLTKILRAMIFVQEMDAYLLKIKNQGRISFYMTSFGQTGCIVGSAAALSSDDYLYSQYREQGAHYWRGLTIDNMINQCIGNAMDPAKGRQMPIHYGSKQLNNITVSSPLSTQITQAAGSGYVFRTSKQNRVAACYFGQGGASQGDFPTALNFAATLKCQTLFLCRNNKYAISTRTSDQYASDGVVPRAISMGIASSRVDGNDALACLVATRNARKYILEHRKPYFIQFMTYRVGDHSTSDNSALYRQESEKKYWIQINNPIKRLFNFFNEIGYINTLNESYERQKASEQIKQALHRCMKHKLPPLSSLFDDVYDKLPQHLIQQREQLQNHLANYGDKYPNLDKFQK